MTTVSAAALLVSALLTAVAQRRRLVYRVEPSFPLSKGEEKEGTTGVRVLRVTASILSTVSAMKLPSTAYMKMRENVKHKGLKFYSYKQTT
jgi:hypothetical protein